MSDLTASNSEGNVTITDRVNELRCQVDRCCGLHNQQERFCENFGCSNIVELLGYMDALQAENDRRREEREIIFTHLSEQQENNPENLPVWNFIVALERKLEDAESKQELEPK